MTNWLQRFFRQSFILTWLSTVAALVTCLYAASAACAEESPSRLNNLVTELARIEGKEARAASEIGFETHRNGWVFFQVEGKGEVQVTGLDAATDAAPLLQIAGRGRRAESMRLLGAGAYRLKIHAVDGAEVTSLVVRAMPETHYVRYPQEPRFPQLGTFDWEWLKANVLSSVNTVVIFPETTDSAIVNEWTGAGRKMISYGHLPKDQGLTGENAFAYWYDNAGFQDVRLSGVIADEFSGRQDPLYPAWIEGMRRLGAEVRGKGQAFYAYCGGPGMYSRPEARALVETVFQAGFYMAWERYHHEMPTLGEAREFMDGLLGKEIVQWKKRFPDCQKQMVLVLGIFSTGPDIDVRPDVNYKVWMDMQMNYLATHPEFDGLYGVHWWYSGAADEEILRWESALYRHYAIEGATELLSRRLGWTYSLDHIKNPDFHEALEHWEAEPAASDSIRTGYLERFARVQGRYWQREAFPDDPAGNTYLWMRRQENAPNRVTQPIRYLKPGQLYTVQMISADYEDITGGRSIQGQHALSLSVEGAEIVSDGCYSGISVRGAGSHMQLPFPDGPPWFNHHRVMFRATTPEAELAISDWVSPEDPGGPVGQELMLNYLQLQPYFESPPAPGF